MKTEQEQIEEMKNELLAYTPFIDIPYYTFNEIAKAICNIGYRKAGEVIDDFVERLEKRFSQTETIANCLHGRKNTEIDSIIKIVATEMRQEVEK